MSPQGLSRHGVAAWPRLVQIFLGWNGGLVLMGMLPWQPKLKPSGKRLHNYGKSPFFMGKSTISMAISNSYVKFPEGNWSHLEMILATNVHFRNRGLPSAMFAPETREAIPMMARTSKATPWFLDKPQPSWFEASHFADLYIYIIIILYNYIYYIIYMLYIYIYYMLYIYMYTCLEFA